MTGTTRLRSACDACHQLKVRCSGCLPCKGCTESGRSCLYRMSSRLGRPPGVKKKGMSAPQPKQQATHTAEFAFSSKPIPSPSNKPTMICTAAREKTALAWNHRPMNESSISRPVCPQKLPSQSQAQLQLQTQSHVQAQTLPQTQTQTHASLSQWPPSSGQSPQLLTPTAQSVGSDDSSVNPGMVGGSYSMPGVHDPKNMLWNTASHDYSDSSGGSWRSQLVFGPSDKDLLEHRRLVLDDSPQTSDFELGLPMPASYVSPSTSLDPSWDEIPGLDGAGANTFFESRSTDTSQDESEHCQCLQHHTELLCALKIPKSSRSRLRTWPALDHTLLHVQEALRVWRGLIKCPTCAHNGDQEVLILALMCVGAVLTQLRHASWRDSAVGSPESCSDKNRLQSQAATTRSPHSSKSQYSTPDSLAINCTNRSHMQVGDFEVTGHDKSSLLQLLLLNMLHKIAAVLMLLREVLERKKSLEKASGSSFLPAAFQGDLGREQWQESRHGTSSLVAEQMMQSIMSSVESLMGVLKPLDM